MSDRKRSLNLTLPIFLIYTIGLLMIFDASSGEIVDLLSEKSVFSGMVRQIAWGVIATVAMLVTVKVGWEKIYQHVDTIFWILVVMLVLVFVPGIGIGANGAKRWIGVSFFRIQPSEFVKIILPAYFIHACAKDPEIFSSMKAFSRLVAKVAFPVALVALEPNNGTAGVIAVMIFVLTVIANIPVRFYLLPLCIIGVGLLGFAATNAHVQKRISTYLHPENDIRGKGHQPYQAKIAAGSGGIFGRGPARSVQKLSYLPEAQNDYIAAIYAEEYGFLGIIALLFMYSWAIYEALLITKNLVNPEAFCWGMGIVYLLSFQTFMNLGVVSGLLPSTGLNLPFFSQGGSSLVANCIGVGVLISMMKQSKQGVRSV